MSFAPRLPMSLAQLLAPFRPCFTARTFVTFTMLVAGLIAAPARRTVCGMLTATGGIRVRQFLVAFRGTRRGPVIGTGPR
jgi:hypothetical protein